MQVYTCIRKEKGDKKMMNMETVREVNGYKVQRTPNTQRFYYVYLTEHKFVTFHTIKAAVEYINRIS